MKMLKGYRKALRKALRETKLRIRAIYCDWGSLA